MKQARRVPASKHTVPVSRVVDRPFLARAAPVFGLALLVRLIHVWQLRGSPFWDVLLGDAHGYDEWARRIAGGEWIGTDVFYQAPLYPYFLGVIYAAVGHSVLAVRLAQAVIGAGACALLALAGRRFFSDAVGLVAGLVLALYAPAIFFDGLLQKSVLDLFFLTLTLWLLARLIDDFGNVRSWLALGLAMGALSLTRENALVFIVIILAWCFAARGIRTAHPSGARLRLAGTFVLGLAIVLLPVALRNYAVGGGFYLTTSQFGPNFYIGNNPKSDGTYMSLRYGRGAPEYERQDATELAEHALGRSLTPAEVSTYWTDKALDFITTQPGAWLRLLGRKSLLLINATEMLDTESQESYAEYSWPLRVLGPVGHFGLLMPLALIGAMIAWRDRTRLGLLYVMTVAYAASVLLFYIFARYRLPLVPLFILFAARAAAALPRLLETLRRGGARALVPRLSASSGVCALLVVFSAVAANWPVLSASLMKAITETNLATALQAEGRTDEAAAHYRRAIALQPDYAPAYNNLGVALRASGAVDAAISAYEQALEVKSDYPDAHYNLANALLQQNRADEAADHFAIALRSIPDSAGVRNNLGIALTAQGKHEDALAAFQSAVAAEPGSAVAHRNLGDALASAGRTTEAVSELRRAAQLNPADEAAHYNLGSVLLEAGVLDGAIAEFRAALQLNPRSAEAHNNLGIALGSQGKLAEAIGEFEQALTINPGFADSQRNLAMARQALGQMGRTP